jgi:hypothetical protein
VQLAFQVCFLAGRIHPNTPEAQEAKMDLNSCCLDIMIDVQPETKLLAAFFDGVKPLLDADGNPPVVANPIANHPNVNTEILFWSIDDIAFVLDNLEVLGVQFKAFLKINNVSV